MRRTTSLLLFTLALANPAIAQQSEPAPAAIDGLTRVTVDFQVRIRGDSVRWSADSLLFHHISVYRIISASTVLRVERRDRNPFGDLAPPAVDPEKLAELRRIMSRDEIDFDRAYDLCAGEAACKRVLDDMHREHSARLGLRHPAAAAGNTTGFLVMEPDGAAACDSALVSILDVFEETVQQTAGLNLGKGAANDMTAIDHRGQATLAEQPTLAALCNIVIVFDLARRVYHVDFPGRAAMEIPGEATRTIVIARDVRAHDTPAVLKLNEADAAKPLRILNLQTPNWFVEPSWLAEWTRSSIESTSELGPLFTVRWGERHPVEVPVIGRVLLSIRVR